MLHTAYKVAYTRNAYGDYVTTASLTAIPCHFRFINEVITSNPNEVAQSDAMAWFNPNAGLAKDALLRINGEYYRVEKIIEGRRLHDTAVQFVKCYLAKYGDML